MKKFFLSNKPKSQVLYYNGHSQTIYINHTTLNGILFIFQNILLKFK